MAALSALRREGTSFCANGTRFLGKPWRTLPTEFDRVPSQAVSDQLAPRSAETPRLNSISYLTHLPSGREDDRCRDECLKRLRRRGERWTGPSRKWFDFPAL